MISAILIAATLAIQAPDTTAGPLVLTLEDALKIALSENVAVKVADQEVERVKYAKKGTYAALFPQIDGSAAYQRTIKKQVMYMDGDSFDFGSMIASTLTGYLAPLYAKHPDVTPPAPSSSSSSSSSSNDGIEVGRWNTFSAGISAALPLVNVQLWQSLKLSADEVELAVEKARSSRLEMVTQVKQAFFGVLMAKEAAVVYGDMYDNALENCAQTQRRYNAQKASELDLARAKTTLANAVPNVYDSQNAVTLSLWQLKAVMGVDLDMDIEVAGELEDYSIQMFYDLHDGATLDDNSTMRQLAIQAEELSRSIKAQQYASLPSLSLGFSYSLNAMTNDFNFSEFNWSPYSYVGINLSIPIFSGGKRLNTVRQAKVQAAELELQRANTERQLQIAIRQYLNTMETAMKSYQAAGDARETAEKAYDIASKSYEVGRSTLTELNDAQLALTQARLSVSQAIFNFVVAKAGLEQTLGYEPEILRQ